MRLYYHDLKVLQTVLRMRDLHDLMSGYGSMRYVRITTRKRYWRRGRIWGLQWLIRVIIWSFTTNNTAVYKRKTSWTTLLSPSHNNNLLFLLCNFASDIPRIFSFEGEYQLNFVQEFVVLNLIPPLSILSNFARLCLGCSLSSSATFYHN